MSVEIENKNTIAVLISIGKSFIIISFIIPAFSLIFRLFDYEELLQKYSFDHDVTNPASAICFILQAVAIWLIRSEDVTAKSKLVSNVICIFIIIIGALRFITGILDLPFYLDEVLFREQIFTQENPKGGVEINLMSPTTGIILIIINTSILLTNYGSHRSYKIGQFLNYITILSALLSLYGYIYQIEYLNSYKQFAPIPMYNTLTIFFQTAGILLLRPNRGSMATLVSENPTQIIFLRFIVLFIPLSLGLFIEMGKNNGWFGKELGTAIYASATFAISVFILGWKSQIQFALRKVRVKIGERIEKDQKLLKQVLNASPVAIAIINLESEKYLFANRSSMVFGIEGKKFTDVMKEQVYEEDQEKALNRLHAYKKLKKDEGYISTFRIYDQSGKLNWLHTDAGGYTYENGKTESVIISSINITKLKELQAEKNRKTKEIENYNKELNKANKELEDIRKNLEEKVKKRIQDVKKSEQACKDFFENSFEAILRYGFKGIDYIDITLDIEEQLSLLFKHTYIAEVNKKFLQLHGFDSPEEIEGTLLLDILNMPKEVRIKQFKLFIESGYKTQNAHSTHFDKDGNAIKLLINTMGIVEDNKLLSIWGTQTILEG